MHTNLLEKTILKKVDELIEILICSSKKEEENEDFYTESVEKAREILPLILHFVDGNTNLAAPMLYQLILEKLPNPQIISSFGNLQEEINVLMKKVINSNNDPKKTPNIQLQSDQSPQNESINTEAEFNFNSSVLKAFPNVEVLFNYRLGGEILEVYIPNLNIILSTDTTKILNAKLKFFCKKQDLKLIKIPPEIALDYRKLLRFIKRQII